MMEYAAAQQMPGLNAPKVTPELGRLKAVAERISAAAESVDRFVFRFHGPRNEAKSVGTEPQPPENYRNDLETIFEQLNRLEGIVAQLDTIG